MDNTKKCPRCGASCKKVGMLKYVAIEAEAREHIVTMANNVAILNRKLAAECSAAIDLLRRIASTENVPASVIAEITTLLGEENEAL